MKPLSYDDWQAAGFQVRKGQKATGVNKAGKPTFTREQVDDKDEPEDRRAEPREQGEP